MHVQDCRSRVDGLLLGHAVLLLRLLLGMLELRDLAIVLHFRGMAGVLLSRL